MHDLRALVVDDSKVGRLTMLRKLETLGIRVDMAESGHQALESLEQSRPDLIFMDHMMPDMDGFEVTRRIKASPVFRDIPVVIVSGNDEVDFVHQAREAGALDAIAKPPATDVLERLLAALPKLPAGAPVKAPPAPGAVEPAPAPALEQVQGLVERLRAELMTELGGLALGRDAALDDLRRQATDMESLGGRLPVIEQRLRALEAEAALPRPDFDAQRAELDQRISAGLAGLQARTEGLESHIEGLREELREDLRRTLLARVDEQAGEAAVKVGALQDGLQVLSGEVDRLAGDLRATRAALEDNVGQLEDAVRAALEEAASAPRTETAEASAAVQAPRSEFAELDARLSEARVRELVADVLGSAPSAMQAHPDETALGAELARLQIRLRRLAVMTAVGGAVLLGVVGLVLFLR
jgi:two-component system cell cycle response regulator